MGISRCHENLELVPPPWRKNVGYVHGGAHLIDGKTYGLRPIFLSASLIVESHWRTWIVLVNEYATLGTQEANKNQGRQFQNLADCIRVSRCSVSLSGVHGKLKDWTVLRAV